jgi:hypothetical protein
MRFSNDTGKFLILKWRRVFVQRAPWDQQLELIADLPKFVLSTLNSETKDTSPFGFTMNSRHQEIVIERPVLQPGTTLQKFA